MRQKVGNGNVMPKPKVVTTGVLLVGIFFSTLGGPKSGDFLLRPPVPGKNTKAECQ